MKIRAHDVHVFDLIVLPRYTRNNTRHNSWDSSGIFYPLNVGFVLLGNGHSTGCPNVM